jgi:predicted small metal-binding protein
MTEMKKLSCECGFSITSPYGEENLLKHAKIHLKDKHPDMKTSDQELREMIEKV